MRFHSLGLAALILPIAVFGGINRAVTKTKAEQNIAIGRRAFDEVYTKGNLSAVDGLYASDFVDDSPGGGAGTRVIKEAVAGFHSAFSGLHVDIEDAFASGDKVVLRYTARGTQTGAYMGVPATGKEMAVRGITIFLITDGKIHREWTEYDRLGVLRQLGVLPSK